MMTLTISRDQVVDASRKSADQLLRHPWKLWFWGDSVGLEGLLAASEITGNQMYIGFTYGLLKGWAARFDQHSKFDHTAAGMVILNCYERTGDEALLELARRYADYLATFRKSAGGCPVHYEDSHIELPPQLPPNHPDYDPVKHRHVTDDVEGKGGACIFVDSVHFHGPFLATLYAITGENCYLEQAEQTIGPQVELLWNEKENLFDHFWSECENCRNGVCWGRGNGWGMLGMLQTLEQLPQDRPPAERFKKLIHKQADRLADLQNESGDWHTVLDDPQSYLESSIAAFVVDGFSLAIRRGWLDDSYRSVVDRAWQAMWKHVRDDGLFDDVSFETFPSFRAEHYCTMPTGAMVPWGQGPFLLACHSYLKNGDHRL